MGMSKKRDLETPQITCVYFQEEGIMYMKCEATVECRTAISTILKTVKYVFFECA